MPSPVEEIYLLFLIVSYLYQIKLIYLQLMHLSKLLELVNMEKVLLLLLMKYASLRKCLVTQQTIFIITYKAS